MRTRVSQAFAFCTGFFFLKTTIEYLRARLTLLADTWIRRFSSWNSKKTITLCVRSYETKRIHRLHKVLFSVRFLWD